MKEPRVNDFNPKSTSLKSPLDDMPAIGRQPQKVAQQSSVERPVRVDNPETKVPSGRTPGVTDGGPPVRTPVRARRTLTRYAFEFFQDQIESLRKFSIEEHIRGEKGSMSQMVRESIDAYIAKRNQVSE